MKLETIFVPSAIYYLKDDVVGDIAGETEESKEERDSSTAKLETLKKALDVLKRLDRGHPTTAATTHGMFKVLKHEQA